MLLVYLKAEGFLGPTQIQHSERTEDTFRSEKNVKQHEIIPDQKNTCGDLMTLRILYGPIMKGVITLLHTAMFIEQSRELYVRIFAS